ncbi:branched-chain amino acid transport system II carrier protein [Faecalibaculum rodentium]|uniref:branched-chain amino acid transport system II carrier protein n=1 Tax=Faecalibaculum rodentium TaxID=1702221 RepID=UPI0023EF8181|nr:branched-chain amino acid transport system II carrier protein [Faecalibaculum rodentium]
MNRQTLFLGITLFSMFFGAGNLIFSPYMAAQAGALTPAALLGFVITAVVLPVSAIVIIAPYGSASRMISRLWKPLGPVFLTLVYLLIGPCIAIPRTAGTSLEMWTWLIGSGWMPRILYTVVFFALASLLALHPGKLKDILGKLLGPALLVLILLLCVPVLLHPGNVAQPSAEWADQPFFTGLEEGYQTMDILAAFCFSVVILLNIRQAHLKNVKRALLFAGLTAGVLLAVVYTLLAVSAMSRSTVLQPLSNGAQILSAMALETWGSAGQVLCGLIFLLACCNVCAGLLASCSEYFCELLPAIPYRLWLALFAAAGALLAVTGLDSILSWSGQLLSLICPVAILLLVTGLFRRPVMGQDPNGSAVSEK